MEEYANLPIGRPSDGPATSIGSYLRLAWDQTSNGTQAEEKRSAEKKEYVEEWSSKFLNSDIITRKPIHPLLPMERWNSSILRKLYGDIGAATISATLITPIITIIDRALVEKSSFNQPIIRGLRTHTLGALRNPARFVFQVPFGLIWTLYAATYAVANGADTLSTELKAPATGMITFLSTTIVNVPLGVWKDLKYAQIFGTQQSANNVETVRKSLVQNRGVARAATAMFLARDSITIFGSFTLAPRLASVIPDDLTSHPHAKPVITQLTVPVLTQLVATPLHLFALDLYIRQHHVPLSDRIVQSQRYLGSTTVFRCIRIIPAFGFGCLANMELRSTFHEKLDVGAWIDARNE